MPDVSVKMGVDGVSQFKKAMEESQGAVKNLDAELKLSEAQYRATGDAETYLQTKTSLLTKQIQEQKNVVKQAEQALKAMKDKGVSETSASFQKMEGNLIKAKTKLTDMETALKNVDSEAKTAGDSLQGIGKNVAWDTVAEGLGKITDKLQSAGRTALRLGKTIAKSAMDSTEWADDILTRAAQYGIDAETLQRMENVADYIDTDVDTIIAARDRLSKNRKSLGELLGIESNGKSVDDVFWEAGEAIMNLGDEFDKTEISQKIFGRSWRELIPLFEAGREVYESMMENQNVLTNEQVENLGKADDAFKSIKQEWELMKNEFWSNNAENITSLLQWIIDNADAVKAGLTVIAGGFGLLKIGEFAANIGQIVSGLSQLGILSGGAAAATSAGGIASTAGGGLSLVKSLLPAAAPVATMFAGGYLGAKMIEANMNDVNLNAIYGQGGGKGGIIDTMSDQAAQAAKEYWDVYQEVGSEAAMNARDKLFDIFTGEGYENAEQGVSLIEQAFDNMIDENDIDGMGEKLRQRWSALFDSNPVKTPVTPEVQNNAASMIAEQIGPVVVPVIPGWNGEGIPKANGIWSVPFDGYTAVLHKNERVVPAREVAASRSYSSNLYVESMYMNNGQDAEGLAAAMAAAQRRTMSGFGS